MSRCGLIACSVLATLALAPTSSAAPDREVVKVVDFVFKPKRLNVKTGETIAFRWSRRNMAPHQVALRTAPKGVDKSDYVSDTAERNLTFNAELNRRGEYRFICTIHPLTMKLNVKVAGA